MPRIHVCSLQRMYATVRETGAGDVVTVIKATTRVPTPEQIAAERHLVLNFSDITEPREGEVMAGERDVAALLDFVTRWDRARPLVIHCYAGVSRSTASAFIAACALRPDRSETEWAGLLRGFSPTASPNRHLVTLGDRLLGREGRMITAIEAIGRGEEAYEGIPFALDIGSASPPAR
jgi:predicted protein tyrosine phosphatase